MLVLAASTQVEGMEFVSKSDFKLESPALEKIYVNPDQLHIIPEGIFFLSEEGNLVPACGVFRDQMGIYVVAESYKCPSCGMRNRNNVCINTSCPLYGK